MAARVAGRGPWGEPYPTDASRGRSGCARVRLHDGVSGCRCSSASRGLTRAGRSADQLQCHGVSSAVLLLVGSKPCGSSERGGYGQRPERGILSNRVRPELQPKWSGFVRYLVLWKRLPTGLIHAPTHLRRKRFPVTERSRDTGTGSFGDGVSLCTWMMDCAIARSSQGEERAGRGESYTGGFAPVDRTFLRCRKTASVITTAETAAIAPMSKA